MAVHVAFLRGINVGGRTKVAMPTLRGVMEALGFEGVRTYIQSGNVVFSSAKKPAAITIERALASAFGFDIAVMLRTAAELAKVVDANPFTDTANVHVGFLAKAVPPSSSSALDPARYEPEEFTIAKTEVYFHLPNGMGRAKVPEYVGRALKVPMTVRNWNTVTALLEMTRE